MPPLKIPFPTMSRRLAVWHPNGDFFEFDEKLEGVATLDEIKNGHKAILLSGTVVYSTVFAVPRRETNFRYYVGGDMGCEGDQLFAASDGNDAA
jgi:hypothetical protein